VLIQDMMSSSFFVILSLCDYLQCIQEALEYAKALDLLNQPYKQGISCATKMSKRNS
jgi:hypothetical protein